MPVTIKLEEVVNDNEISDSVSIDSYNNLQCQNENLQLLLSISKEACSDQESKLIDCNYQIDEMTNSISNLEEQISILKRENEQSADIIADRNNIFDLLYETIGNLDSRNNYSVSDPKSALIKLNDFQQTIKELRNKVIDNKILIMTMCKILGCADTRIIQSLKDIICENEINKQKYKIYEQFYTSSRKAMNQISLELHRNGYDKSLDINSMQQSCSIHKESFDNWNQKMANLRHNSAVKSDIFNGKSPTTKRENCSNQNKPVNFPLIPSDFYRQIPPPGLLNLPALCGMNIACPVGGLPAAQLQVNERNPGRQNRASPQFCNSNTGNTIITDCQESNDSDGSSAFEINSNVFDWKNDASAEARDELMKLERKMHEPSSSKSEIKLSPSLTLIEDGIEIYSSDSDSDIEPKRSKMRINYT